MRAAGGEEFCQVLPGRYGSTEVVKFISPGALGAQGDRKIEKEKLGQALAIFSELKLPRQRDAVQKEFGQAN
jgi:hypothetical protein